MKLTLAEPKYLKESVSVISELVNEAKFTVNNEGMELVAMDPANVAMVVFKLLSSAFVEYDVPAPVDLAINLANLKQVLARAKPNDVLTLELDATKTKLVVELKGTSTRTFSLSLIDLDDRPQRIPNLNFPVKVTTDSSTLNEAIEDVDVVSESVTFHVTNNTFTVQAEGDLSHAKVVIDNGETTSIVAPQEAKSKYSIEYMKKIIKASKLAPQAVVQFNKDYPLRVEYKAVDRLLLAFILAPRVEND